ncbi:TonB-dependent Receptor Plug Domain protein [compost metagenome]
MVEKNGALSDVMITRGLGSGTDEEALRVIKASPKWHPGIQNGLPVRVKYNINVNFSLSDGEVKSVKTPLSIRNRNDIKFNGLVVLDGVKLAENTPLSTINPNNIESIEVLKDQAAIDLYGMAAKGGAILITTKVSKNSTFRKPEIKELSIDKNSPLFEFGKKF